MLSSILLLLAHKHDSHTMIRPSLCLAILAISLSSIANDHNHGQQKEPVARPRVFLDKSRRVVEYQLKRLNNERLLLVERKTNDKKYVPVYEAILARPAMSPQYREEAADALTKLKSSSVTAEVLAALGKLKETRQDLRTAKQLNRMLFDQADFEIRKQADAFEAATEGKNQLTRSAGYAGLIAGGKTDKAWQLGSADEAATLDWLAGVAYVPDANSLRPNIVELVGSASADVRKSATHAISFVSTQQGETFKLLAPLVSHDAFRNAAVATLNSIPTKAYDPDVSGKLLETLVAFAENTPAAKRTSNSFLDAMQLADRLFAKVPDDAAKSYRDRLSEVTVRVVRIHTVEEEMRYDIPFFAVEAGRPVQVVLTNEDLMPHNLVITKPGALKEVAQLGLEVGPNNGVDGKQYVPNTDKVLFATNMVPAEQQEALTFTAPDKPGEYPFVCTFPRHWMRMYGVMVVTEDLVAWQKNPVKPKDPIGSNRAFVKSWRVKDLAGELDAGLRGRTASIGERLFKEATCLQCHKIKGQGGAVGPELTDVFKRWKGDKLAVLREILEPSHRIDSKYAVRIVVTDEGQSVSGLVTAEDKDTISLLPNPEAKEPVVIEKDAIDEMVKTSTSMMPKALLDRFTKDEIFEILAYIQAAGGQAR